MVALAVALGACSGGDDEPAAATITTAADTTSETTGQPTFAGDADSAFCNLLRGVDTSSVLAGDPTDTAAVEAGFRRLVGVLRDAHALAPQEIEGDVALVTAGIEALDAALAAVDYDFDALAASGGAATLTEAANDPAFTAAGDRVTAYRTQVCRL